MSSTPGAERGRRKFRFGAGFVLVLLVLIFTVQNTAVVRIRFLVFEGVLSLSLLIFLLFGAGLAVGWLTTSLRQRRRSAND